MVNMAILLLPDRKPIHKYEVKKCSLGRETDLHFYGPGVASLG